MMGGRQFYLPNLDDAGKKQEPKFRLEYVTYPVSMIHPPSDNQTGRQQQCILPLRHLPRSLQNETRTSSKYAPYRMEDLTIPSWLKLAHRMVQPKHEKLRDKFRRYMYMGSDLED